MFPVFRNPRLVRLGKPGSALFFKLANPTSFNVCKPTPQCLYVVYDVFSRSISEVDFSVSVVNLKYLRFFKITARVIEMER